MVKKRHQVLRREHEQMAAALQTIKQGTLLAEHLKTRLGHEKMVLEQKKEVCGTDNNRDSVVVLIVHPSSGLRPRAGMERGIMVGQLYLRVNLFCQVEVFCDYTTRRSVPIAA